MSREWIALMISFGIRFAVGGERIGIHGKFGEDMVSRSAKAPGTSTSRVFGPVWSIFTC